MKDQKKLTYVIAAVVVIIIVGVVAAGGMKKDSSTGSSASTSSSSSKAMSSDTSSAVATTAVQIKDYMFAPMVTKVKVGDTVTWTNMDSVHHNVVADNPSSDAPNGPLIGQGEKYSFKFTKAGTYTFHCQPHPYMHGTVVVE